MRRDDAGKTVLRVAVFAALICTFVSLLALSYRLSDLNRSLRAQTDVLNGLLAERQAEISRLRERIAADGDSSATLPAEAGAYIGAAGVWEPAPPRLWSEHRAYQELYPSLRAERPEKWFKREKTVYLTFDDGPTIYTARVLDTLKDAGVKGTFFVVGDSVARLGEEGEALLVRMAEEGHTIGVHCNVHDYNRVYKSVAAFLDDFNAVFTLIRETAGVRPDIFRFPGGSVNRFNDEIRTELVDEMARRGFTHYDWNASANDANNGVTEDSAWRSAVSRAGKVDRVILLLHDTKAPTVQALPRIIETYKSEGYDFARLTNSDKPITL
jgi:peptidoglycan/xylan/chitin deacetylase (PgdA/CDA1 family)